MGHISRTPSGRYRANWRDLAGRQKAKTFGTKREATMFLAEVGTSLNRGAYVDPHAGRQPFEPYARRWLAARTSEKTTAARGESMMRTNVLPHWGEMPIAKIDHLAVQAWVSELSQRRAQATVGECYRLLNGVLRSAVRDRIIGANPCDGVRLPRRQPRDLHEVVLTMDEITGQLLPAVPHPYRALVALAGGTGLRWGECVGLRWDAVDSETATVRVTRVAVEVAGTVTSKPYPKTRGSRRVVPLPGFVIDALTEHRNTYEPGPAGEVFRNTAGGPPRRTTFRARVWRPALVRAGFLGTVIGLKPDKWSARWLDSDGIERAAEHRTEPDAVAHVARHHAGGIRFHDLRHSYATHLVSSGVPVNDVQRVLGHEQASTTLNRYTHASQSRDANVRGAFADDSLTDPD